VHGLNEGRLRNHGTPGQLADTHIIMMSETQKASQTCEDLFPNHTMYSLPHTANTPGGGLSTLIRNEIARHAVVWRTQQNLDCLWLRVDGIAVGLEFPVFLGNCYLPCASSNKLDDVTLQDRYIELGATIAEAQTMGYVILGGDMNAHIDHTVPLVFTGVDPCSSGLSPSQNAQDRHESGKRLRGLCQNMGLQWLTGSVEGDFVAIPSFYHGNGSGGTSRVDHILVDDALMECVVSSRVRLDITGSDHYPVESIWELETANQPQLRKQCRRLNWKKGSHVSYYEKIASQLPQLGDIVRDLGDLASEEHVSCLLKKVGDVLVQGALESGCKFSGNQQRSQPKSDWFDTECVHLRREIRRVSRCHPGSTRLGQLNRKFRTLCKKKKKEHARGKVYQLMEDVKSNPQKFWKHFKSKSMQKSGDVQAAVSFWSAVFNKNVDVEQSYFLGSIDDDVSHCLNQDITPMEVSEALSKLKSGTASGSDGLPPELFKYANVWSEDGSGFAVHLSVIFNHIFRLASVPADWGSALLTLVYKSGERTDWGNYRPIAVMKAVSKVFASVLNIRLMGWAESSGIRAASQAGFRPKYSTSMQAFVLNHLIEQRRQQGHEESLYACFVDFRKAYDSVPRDKLWKRLYDKGIRGRMLFTLQALYSNVSFSIKFPGGLSEEIPSSMGVRQGCPLSPFLFGVFIEMFDEQLRAKYPMAGPVLAGGTASSVRVPLLLYADDLVLMACSERELQLLLDCLSAFATSVKMSVNLGKTKIVMFRRGRKRLPIAVPWTYQGVVVEVVDSYKYLGLNFNEFKPVEWVSKQQVPAATRSLGGMLGYYSKSAADKNVWLLLSLFKVIVMPVLLYGCEVWGACLLSDDLLDFSDDLSRMRLAFFRQLLGVRKSTSSLAMLRELGEYPLQLFIVSQLIKFWNKAMTIMPVDSFVRIALLESRALALQGCKTTWFWYLYSFLSSIGCSEFVADDDGYLHLFDLSKVVKVMRESYHSEFRDLPIPIEAKSDELKLSIYHHWFASPLPRDDEEWQMQGYLRKCFKYSLITKLSRFRLGSHNLRIETEKWKHKKVQADIRSRYCLRCHQNLVDDECHAVFYCSHFQDNRSQFPDLFEVFLDELDVQALFNSVPDARRLAMFLESLSVV
jgi:Reverse transcriptase (RNA-dependent DNA polymerase)